MQSMANFDKSEMFVIGPAKAPLFTDEHRMQCSANNITWGFYVAPILLTKRHWYTTPIFSEVAHKIDSTDRKRKYVINKMKAD
jgi:hypothetical protein